MRISKRTKNVLVYLVLLPATFPAISTILKFVRCIKSITIRISIFSSFPILNKFDLSIANFFKDLYLIALRIKYSWFVFTFYFNWYGSEKMKKDKMPETNLVFSSSYELIANLFFVLYITDN